MLSLVGAGLGGLEDFTLRGRRLIEEADYVYLEAYTSVLPDFDAETATHIFERPFKLLHRTDLENAGDELVIQAANHSVVIVVVGDPLAATTHIDILSRAHNQNVKTNIVHNASIMTAIAETGLQINEYTPESLLSKTPIMAVPRIMTVAQAAEQLIKLESLYAKECCGPDRLAMGVARLGSSTQTLRSGTLEGLTSADLGPGVQCLVLTAPELSPEEIDFLPVSQSFAFK